MTRRYVRPRLSGTRFGASFVATLKVVNVRDGLRLSYQSDLAESPNSLDVHFFGGSTMFGTGQRDNYTIPSQVARRAESDGVPIRVTNHGQNGWVIWEALAEFQLMFARGEIPDVAVFYDGYNETLAQFQSPGRTRRSSREIESGNGSEKKRVVGC